MDTYKKYGEKVNDCKNRYRQKGFDEKKYNEYIKKISESDIPRHMENIQILSNSINIKDGKVPENFPIRSIKEDYERIQKEQAETDKRRENLKNKSRLLYQICNIGSRGINALVSSTRGTGAKLGALVSSLWHDDDEMVAVWERANNGFWNPNIPISTRQAQSAYENGKIILNWDNGPGIVSEGIVSMLTLVAGGGAITKGLTKGATKIGIGMGTKLARGTGLVSSGFIQQAGPSFGEGLSAGMTGNQAMLYAITSATLQGSLELLSPNEFINGLGKNLAKTYIKEILKSGSKQSLKTVGKLFLKNVGSEIGEEIFQEEVQLAAGNLINMRANDQYNLTGTNKLDADWNPKNFAATAIVTALTTGFVAGGGFAMQSPGIGNNQNREQLIGHIQKNNELHSDVMNVLDKAIAGKFKIPNVDVKQLQELKGILISSTGNTNTGNLNGETQEEGAKEGSEITSDTYQKVDVQEYVSEGLKEGRLEIIEAEKSAKIQAVRGTIGQEVISWSVDEQGNPIKEKVAKVEADPKTGEAGRIVTKVDEAGNPIVDKNGNLNQWIIDNTTFNKKYEIDNTENGIYKATGGIQKFVKIKDNIILDQWGSEFKIAKGGYINITNPNDMYGISGRDFDDTYKIVEPSEIKGNNLTDYFNGKSHQFNVTETQARSNSEMMDNLLKEINEQNKSEKLNEQNKSEKLNELRKQISEQYKQATGENLNLTDEQLLSILDAHEQDGVLGELTLGQLRQKVKILDKTITDPKVKRFLLEAGFCGSIFSNLFNIKPQKTGTKNEKPVDALIVGDYQIGQIVNVPRSDGSITPGGTIQEYNASTGKYLITRIQDGQPAQKWVSNEKLNKVNAVDTLIVGDYQIGQIVNVPRSDGSITPGATIIDFSEGKYLVTRDQDGQPAQKWVSNEKLNKVNKANPEEDSDIIMINPEGDSDIIMINPEEDSDIIMINSEEDSDIIMINPEEDSNIIMINPEEDSDIINNQQSRGINTERREMSEVHRNSDVVAIGDLHGEYEALKGNMEYAGLAREINGHLERTGGNKKVVFQGDILADRGTDGLRIIQEIHKLKEQARQQGGDIDIIVGNHDDFMISYLLGLKGERFLGYRVLDVIKPSQRKGLNELAKFIGKDIRDSENLHGTGTREAILQAMRNSQEGKLILEEICNMKLVSQVDDVLYIHTNPTAKMLEYLTKGNVQQNINLLNQKYQGYLRNALLGEGNGSISLEEFNNISDIFLDTNNRPKYGSEIGLENYTEILKNNGINMISHGHNGGKGYRTKQIGGIIIVDTDYSYGHPDYSGEHSVSVIKKEGGVNYMGDSVAYANLEYPIGSKVIFVNNLGEEFEVKVEAYDPVTKTYRICDEKQGISREAAAESLRKVNNDNYFDGKSQKIFKGDTTKAKSNSKYSDKILSEINEQNKSEKLEELRKTITEQYKQSTGEELNLTDEQLLSILDAHKQNGKLGELEWNQIRHKNETLAKTIKNDKVRRFLLEAGFCGKESEVMNEGKTNVEHLEELGIKILEVSKERFNKMNLDFEVIKGLKELLIDVPSHIIDVSQFIKFDIAKLKHFQELGIKINEGNIFILNEADLNNKGIINFRELQKIGIQVYKPEILNGTEFDYQKLGQLKELGININEDNIIELNKAEINFQILKRLKNIGIKLSDEDIIGISSDKIEINIDKLEQLKEIGVDINEDNVTELNGTDFNINKLKQLKEIGVNINEDNVTGFNEAEFNIDKLEQLKEIGVDINEDNVTELNGTDFNFDKLRYLKEIGININDGNITKLNKINDENILMLKKIGNEKVQVIIKHKGLDVTSKPEWFIKHINIFTVPHVMSRVTELNKMGIIISYDNHNLLIPKNFKKIKQFSELGIDVSKDTELCLNTEITQDIIKRLNTLKGFGISPVRLKAINIINNLENRGIETNDILSQEYTVNYKEYGIKEDEIKANLQYKKGEIIEKIQQYIQNAISKKENIGETEIINRIRTNLMILPKIERLNLLTTISEVVEKSNNIRKYIDFENGPYKNKYPNAKTLLCAIRGITEPNIIDKITDDVTVIQHGTGLCFFIGDEKSYQIIRNKSLTDSEIENLSGGFNTTGSEIKELEGTLSVVNGKDPGKDTSQFEYEAIWHEGQHNRNSYFMPDKYKSRIAYSKDEILAYSRDGTSIEEIEETLTTPENKGGLYQYNLKGKERENHKRQVKELLGFASDLFELANNSKTGLTRDKVISMLTNTPADKRKDLHTTITNALKIHIERSTNQTNFDQSKIRELKERFINKIKERAGNNKLINNLLDFWNSTFSEYKINPEELWWAGTAKKETIVNEIESCNSIDEIKHTLNNPKYSHIGRGPNNKGGFEISAIIDEVIVGRVERDILPLEIRPKIEGLIKK